MRCYWMDSWDSLGEVEGGCSGIKKGFRSTEIRRIRLRMMMLEMIPETG